MSVTVIQGDLEVREAIAGPIKKFSDTVGSTAGPKGKLVSIRQGGYTPHLTKDGMTVARAFSVQGIANDAIDLIRESALETGRRAGDGTTTASTLSYSLYEAIWKGSTQEERHQRINALKQIQTRVPEIMSPIVQSVDSKEKLFGVAMTASNGDQKLSEIITEAFSELGANGAVSVEEDRTITDVRLKMIRGTTIPAGFTSPYFINDGKSKVEFQKPLIWFSLMELKKVDDVLPVLRYAAARKRPLLIVCEKISDEVTSILITNNSRGAIQVCAINSPYVGNLRVATMQDMSVICGAKPTTGMDGFGMDSSDPSLSHPLDSVLGEAELVTVESGMTSMFEPKSNMEERALLINSLKSQLATNPDEAERRTYQARLSALEGRAAIVRVGGNTPSELLERKDRADDAVASVRWAMIKGIMPGCGTALSFFSIKVGSIFENEKMREDFREAFLYPMVKVVSNFYGVESSLDSEQVSQFVDSIHANVKEGLDSGKFRGYDLRNESECEDLVADGVIDSAYAVMEAITTAITTAITLGSLRAMIHEGE